ncbi:hypothetical protein B0H63DRAFT_521109 [Podospora didyma]|uniref:Uncharacterized protein n=1 Tax=Podospora didyma TaxID=330526 RepID=A0AAE0NSS6_9PEZI|nr:hypothetical protein B0H63DRAFT_521109 [Podospora didyma]
MEATSNEGEIAQPQQQKRATSDAHFRAFDAYPWAKDQRFFEALMAMLGSGRMDTSNISRSLLDREKSLSITLQARMWWYQTMQGIVVERNAYEVYASSSSSSPPDAAILAKVDVVRENMEKYKAAKAAKLAAAANSVPASAQDSNNIPAWMTQAPQKVDLNKKADDNSTRDMAAGGDVGASYPAQFQAIIEAVTTGKPVAGVREIPNTVVRQEGITPIGKMQAPPKPWERKQQSTPASAILGAGSSKTGGEEAASHSSLIDQEFPPIADANTE